MIILGATNDEKGAQLERLTVRILESLGYQQVSTNVIQAGASEVDVNGKYLIPGLGGSHTEVEIICECKAHVGRIGMDDWHKLLGKFHVARLKSGNVVALLLALNGFNGNVIGAHQEYDRLNRGAVLLFGREPLELAASQLYSCVSREMGERSLLQFTRSKMVRLELAYLDEQLYWVAEFVDGRFAVLDAVGFPIPITESAKVLDLVSSAIGGGAPIDLLQEQEALSRRRLAAKIHIAVLFHTGGRAQENTLFADGDYSPEEHRSGLAQAIDSEIVEADDDGFALTFRRSDEPLEDFVKIVQFWFDGIVPIAYLPLMMNSELYIQRIDLDLARHACTIQGEIPVPADRLEAALKWLRLSPNGLLHWLTPQPHFLQHRTIDPISNPAVDAHDVEEFLDMAFTDFMKDFHTQALGAFYYVRGIREVVHESSVTINGPGGVTDRVRSRTHLLMVRLDESIGGGFALVSSLPGVPTSLSPVFDADLRKATHGKIELYMAASAPQDPTAPLAES